MKKTEILKRLNKAYELISEARAIIEDLNEEQTSDIENYPENLQGSSNYERAEEIQAYIEDLLSTLEQAESESEETKENIESI